MILWQSENANDFGNSWAIDEDECNPVTDTPSPCEESSDAYNMAVELCRPLVNETGWYRLQRCVACVILYYLSGHSILPREEDSARLGVRGEIICLLVIFVR